MNGLWIMAYSLYEVKHLDIKSFIIETLIFQKEI